MKSRLQSIIGDEVSQFLETNNLTDKTLKQLEVQISRLVSQEEMIALIETPKHAKVVMSPLKKADLEEFNSTLPDINLRASLTNVGDSIKKRNDIMKPEPFSPINIETKHDSRTFRNHTTSIGNIKDKPSVG